MAIQNSNRTADMDNVDYNIDVHSLASSTSPREECPEMEDYDQTLMELGDWQPFGANVDHPVEAAMGSGTASEDAGDNSVESVWIDQWMRLLGAARHRRTRAAGCWPQPGPFQQPPLLSSVMPHRTLG